MSVPTIDVVIVDDHEMFAEVLGQALDSASGLTVVGIATTAAAALELVRSRNPDVVIVDYHMPHRDGAAIATDIRRDVPGAAVLMLTGSTEDEVLAAAIAAGCSGVVTKDQPAAAILDAVRAAAAGRPLITPTMMARALPTLTGTRRRVGDDLTDREREVLQLVAEAVPTKDIAAQLHLSVNTVRNHIQAVLTKLGAHSKLEAVRIAVAGDLVAYPTGEDR